MKDEYRNIPLVKNEADNSFEMKVDGHIAVIEYKETSSKIALIHTEVPKALGGRGVASAIVEKTLNYIKEQGKLLLPFCPYVFAYIKKHPEWKSLVSPKFKDYDKL
ncbi:GNAT family N-acetyltransferase [Hwangdonia sp.]|uniref:GNAT family N-acetyltransferase n=1 Tax=Hwangdonia sp. TaxID=1883432 RepID=UPI003AB1FDDF